MEKQTITIQSSKCFDSRNPRNSLSNLGKLPWGQSVWEETWKINQRSRLGKESDPAGGTIDTEFQEWGWTRYLGIKGTLIQLELWVQRNREIKMDQQFTSTDHKRSSMQQERTWLLSYREMRTHWKTIKRREVTQSHLPSKPHPSPKQRELERTQVLCKLRGRNWLGRHLNLIKRAGKSQWGCS